MNPLRNLDFDDLALLQNLMAGLSITETAQQLKLTQPAISQRIRKIESVFSCKLMEKSGRAMTLTNQGRAICHRASAAWSLMQDSSEVPASEAVNIGTRPEIGRSWVSPAVCALRTTSPELFFQLHFGSGEEIIRLLGSGSLDGIITSAPHTTRGYEAIELATEHYAFVSSAALADKIRTVEDLEHHILIEHDRSFPFQRYAPPDWRARMRFRDVWFVGSSQMMTDSIAQGFGVGIVPLYQVEKLLEEGKVIRLFPDLELDYDTFRLIFRENWQTGAIQQLAEAMIKMGLR